MLWLKMNLLGMLWKKLTMVKDCVIVQKVNLWGPLTERGKYRRGLLKRVQKGYRRGMLHFYDRLSPWLCCGQYELAKYVVENVGKGQVKDQWMQKKDQQQEQQPLKPLRSMFYFE